MNTRIHTWWPLLLFVGLLPISELICQTDELTWQPIPLSQIGSVVSVEVGFVWAVSNRGGTGPVHLQKRSWNGDDLWEQVVSIGSFNEARVTDILPLPNGKLLAFISSFECDYFGRSSVLMLDSLGKILSGNILEYSWNGHYSQAVHMNPDTDFPVLVWHSGMVDPFTLEAYGPSELIRLDSLTATPVKVSIPESSLNRLMFLDDSGQVRVGLVSGGLASLDPVTGQLSDTTDLAFGPVSVILPQTDTTRWFLGPGKIGRVHQDGSVLQEKVLTDLVPVSGLVRDGHLILLTRDPKTYLRDILILEEALDILDTDVQFSDDTGIIGLVGDADHTRVIGQEHQNAFAKAIDPTGSWVPPVVNVTITDLTYQIAERDSLDSGFFCHLFLHLADVGIHIRNDGQDTITALTLTWSNAMQPSLFPDCNYGFEQRSMENLHVPPGDSTWLVLPSLDLWATNLCEGPFSEMQFCMEVSAPNHRIDAQHAGDIRCIAFPWITTGVNEPDAAQPAVLSPNPFRDELQFGTLPSGTVSIRMTDALGRTRMHVPISDTSGVLAVPEGPPGFYLVSGLGRDGQILFRQKLIRE